MNRRAGTVPITRNPAFQERRQQRALLTQQQRSISELMSVFAMMLFAGALFLNFTFLVGRAHLRLYRGIGTSSSFGGSPMFSIMSWRECVRLLQIKAYKSYSMNWGWKS
jgi:hypothetical protein